MSQISITQAPYRLTLANSDLVYEVTSTQYAQPQFQYVCALKDGCGTTLTTIKQQPNPSGKGVFNLGRLVKQYLGYDARESLFEGGVDGFFQLNGQTAKFFRVAFGEEYGTSTTSSVTSYSGIGNATGSASFSGSNAYYYFINGVLDPNSGDWNWNTSSFYSPQPTPSSASFTKSVCLTDAPRVHYARSTDYMTISALNGNILASQSSAQDIYEMRWTLYTASGFYVSESYYNAGLGATTGDNFGGPRSTNGSQLWSQVWGVNTCTGSLLNVQTSGSLLLHMPIGPQNISNLLNYDLTFEPWTYYTIELFAQSGSSKTNYNGLWDKFTIIKSEGNCAYNGVRFAFINDYGVWDWYTFTLADSNTYQIDRGVYKQNFVNYSTTTNTVPYDITRRGNNTFYTNINQDFIATSDWLTQEEADWLEQLFYSPNVYIQEGFNMIPVVITTSTLNTKSNPRTQKNFNYTISYRLANPKRSR